MTIEEKINELQTQLNELKTEANRKNNIVNYGDVYYSIDGESEIHTYRYRDDSTDHRLKKFNNIFVSTCNTQEHLKWYAENVIKVQNRLMQLHEQLCPDYFPNWGKNTIKFSIVFDNTHKKWGIFNLIKLNFPTVYFTEEAAEKAVDILNAEKFMME